MHKIELLPKDKIESLLELQKANLISNIDTKTAQDQGFLTFQYDAPLIAQMMQYLPQPIAQKNNEVIAYALATAKEVCFENEKLKPLIEVCDLIQYQGQKLTDYRYYTMGQTCVAEGSRGEGIFDKLYLKHKELFSTDFDLVITEISNKNMRSQAAHKRVGFETLHQYQQGPTLWNVVVWDFRI
jgi:hypothetical protein